MGNLRELINKYPGYVSVILTLDINTIEDINNMDKKSGLSRLNQIVEEKNKEANKTKEHAPRILYYTNM